MLHEYAVAPEVIATWVDRDEGRYFIGKFGDRITTHHLAIPAQALGEASLECMAGVRPRQPTRPTSAWRN